MRQLPSTPRRNFFRTLFFVCQLPHTTGSVRGLFFFHFATFWVSFDFCPLRILPFRNFSALLELCGHSPNCYFVFFAFTVFIFWLYTHTPPLGLLLSWVPLPPFMLSFWQWPVQKPSTSTCPNLTDSSFFRVNPVPWRSLHRESSFIFLRH